MNWRFVDVNETTLKRVEIPSGSFIGATDCWSARVATIK